MSYGIVDRNGGSTGAPEVVCSLNFGVRSSRRWTVDIEEDEEVGDDVDNWTLRLTHQSAQRGWKRGNYRGA